MSDSMIDETEFATREAWLMTAIENLRPMFAEIDRELPESIRVSTGWTKRARTGSVGWTWISDVAEDKVSNVFISPEIADSVTVLRILLHELIHVQDDCQHGHTGEFKVMWKALGFTGKATQCTAGEELQDTLEALVVLLGDYPHAKMNVGEGGPGKSSGPAKQTARQIKFTCETNPDNKVRISRGNVAKYGAPLCACHQEEMVEAPGQ